MNKLLCAGFSRLKKDKVLWIAMAALLIYSIVFTLNGCRQAAANPMSDLYTLDRYYFHYALLIGMFCSVVTSMFLGTEYSDGTIRNKIAIGHTRTAIYLSNLLISFAASLTLLLVWLIGALVGIPALGSWRMGAGILVYLLISVLYLAAFSAIFTFISMLTTHKSMAEVISLLFFFALLLMGNYLYEALQQPEFNNNFIITTAEGMKMGEPTPNPAYLTGMTREIYQFFADFLPTGQCVQMLYVDILHPLRMMLSSLVITLGVTAAGIFLFRKKNLN